MKSKRFILFLALIMATVVAMTQPAELITQYGPPSQANTWEKFTIPLTAETFGVDESEFELALQNITSLWIGTEMHTGADVGSLDEVMLGDAFFSNFNYSFEGWSSGGDGTMDWIQEGGYDGAYLQISDWATGEYHFLIAPNSWSGDWSDLNGQNLEFWYKTDHPSYQADIKLTTGTINRLVLVTPYGNAVAPNDSVLIKLNIIPAPAFDLQVSFSSSDNECVTVPGPIMVPAGDTVYQVYFHAAEEAEVGCFSVIEAMATNYLTSRITMNVMEDAGVNEINEKEEVAVFPNPCREKFVLSTRKDIKPELLSIYSLTGKQVLTKRLSGEKKQSIDVTGLPAGIYFMEVKSNDNKFVLKLVVE